MPRPTGGRKSTPTSPSRSARCAALVVAGGKRLRPTFCHWAFVGAGGDAADPVLVDVAAALEMLHTFALVHDDVMDGSDVRRGGPSIHRGLMTAHEAADRPGESRRFGEGAAILVGDFAFVYADMLFESAPRAARPVYDELRLELCVGQYLDLAATAASGRDEDRARRIERYKSGKYTVERPLHLGAALAGRLDDLVGPLSAFGLPLGQAFQLRDDLLGVYGDPAATGKPVGDDLREGKLTPLVAAAARLAERVGDGGLAAGRMATLGRGSVDSSDIAAFQQLFVELGAVDEIEGAIARLVDEALTALHAAPLTADAKHTLEELADFVAWRDR